MKEFSGPGLHPTAVFNFDIRPSALPAFTDKNGNIVDTQSAQMAALKAAQVAGEGAEGVDPITPEMTALKAAQAAGEPLRVDPQSGALAKLKG